MRMMLQSEHRNDLDPSRMRSMALNFLRLHIAGMVTIALLAPASAWSQNRIDYQYGPLYRSYFEASGQFGDKQGFVQGDLFLPFNLSDHDILFADIRGNWTQPSTQEGNLGFGYRKILNHTSQNWIFGMYGFFDQIRSSNGRHFTQGTLGIEFLNIDWEFRFNGYLPERAGKSLPGPSYATYHGGTIVIRNPEELAYEGLDLEIGRLLGDWQDGAVELRAFATGYYFDRNNLGYEHMAGAAARLELRLFDLAMLGGPDSRVTIGGQYKTDNLRGDYTSALLSVRIPLGRRKSETEVVLVVSKLDRLGPRNFLL